MTEEEKLEFYLEKIRILAKEKLGKKDTSAMQALKEALNYVEGEFIGY
ncbi:MAG: hypothetical protein Q9M32_03375 [Sulfurimonas sp.]|nr:hypothetical protein [Sulfurimonas sp.]MDQ7062207.1 hypothetical protein [Sulfurimonas sp.]